MTTSGHFAYAATRTFFAALVEGGVNLVIASPGSRSTPLIVGAADTAGIELEIAHDERVAGFMAVGHGKVTRRPAALVCTSGSAGAHYLPAVMEAHLTGVPLIVLTADRPSELQGVGAPQTADQTRFFAGFTRMTRLLADVDEATQDHMHELAAEPLRHATGDRSGRQLACR